MQFRRVGLIGVSVALIAAIVLWWTRHRAPSEHVAPSSGGPVAGSARPDTVGARARTGRGISGSVTIDGQPAAGAAVRLLRLSGQIVATVSDGAGRFALAPVPEDAYVVVAEMPHLAGAFTSIDLRDPHVDSEHVRLVLHACDASIHGTVRDAAGGPISGARIAITEDGLTATTGTATDDTGAFELCVVAGNSTVLIQADGYAQAYEWLAVYGHVRRDFSLAPEATIIGRVVRASDKSAVAGATVELHQDSNNGRGGFLQATSDADGRFVFAGASVGRHELTASADGLVSLAPVPVLAEVGRPMDDLVCELVPAVAVRGRVVEAGKAVPGARVTLQSRHWEGGSWGRPESITDADGSFTIDRLLPGDYALDVRDFSLANKAQSTLAVPLGGISGATIEVETLASIAGRTLHAGKPVDGASVHAESGYATSDGQGDYVLRGLPPGTYHVYAESHRVGAFTSGPSVTVAKGEHKTGVDVDLDLSASIAGTVVDQDGAPVAGMVVQFSLLHGRDFGTATTGEDGTFIARALSGGGSYLYAVQGPQFSKVAPVERTPTPIAVADANTHVTGVVIRIRRERLSISGRVVGGHGEPLPDVTVRVGQGFVYGPGLGAATTDLSGAFALHDLAKGAYTVRATSVSGDHQVDGIAAGRSDVVITLPDPGTIEGTLDGFTSASVFAVRKDAEISVFRAAIHGAGFTIRDIPPGTYDVRVSNEAGYDSQTVTVASGAVVRVALHAQALSTIVGTIVDADTRQPIAGMVCESNGGGAVRTDATGTYRITHVMPGKTEVYCFSGETHASGQLTTTAGQTARLDLVAKSPDTKRHSNAGFTLEEQFGELLVATIEPGGPAERAGLEVGDTLVLTDKTSYLWNAVEQLERLAPGTAVTLTIERADKQQTLSLTLAPLR